MYKCVLYNYILLNETTKYETLKKVYTSASMRTLAPSSLSVKVSTSVISCNKSTTAIEISETQEEICQKHTY